MLKLTNYLIFLMLKQIKYIAGVDEAGRGSLAGPVLAAAVILRSDPFLKTIKDSKQLTPEARKKWEKWIKKNALTWAIGAAEVQEINQLNILQASLLAMKRAVENLSIQPHHIQVDGSILPNWNYKGESIVRGDEKISNISAASILAKVTRDQIMQEAHTEYPQYNFAKHKGYGTPEHIKILKKLGPCPLHRNLFIKKFC